MHAQGSAGKRRDPRNGCYAFSVRFPAVCPLTIQYLSRMAPTWEDFRVEVRSELGSGHECTEKVRQTFQLGMKGRVVRWS